MEKEYSVSKNENLGHSVLVTGFPYDIKENPDKAFERFIEFLKASTGNTKTWFSSN